MLNPSKPDDVRAALRQALPERESRAVDLWLSTFYPFQLGWLLDLSRFSLALKARQLGASHSYAGQATLLGAMFRETSIVVSIGIEEAWEVLDKAHRHARALVSLGSEWARPVGFNKREVRFASGGRVIARPSTSGGRGYSGNVYLDEFAYHHDPARVWDGAAGATMHGGRLRVISTPNGVGNLFHQLCTDPAANDGYSQHIVTLDDAMAQGFQPPGGLKECWRMARGDPRVFDQMFRCSFLDGAMQYIPTDAIDAVATLTKADVAQLKTDQFFAGLDIGREADRTVLTVLALERGVRHVVHVEQSKRTDGTQIDAMVDRAFAKYKLRRLCIDATGLGAFPAEAIKKRHSERVDVPHRRPRVEPHHFTPKLKEELATGLYGAIAAQTVRLPAVDDALHLPSPDIAKTLRKDIAAIRRIVTNAGNVVYDAARTSEGHADSAWSLALALYACSTVNPMIEALSR